jgi:outer membrane protein OmpA-like peptidoglycan-associated protein
VVLTDPQQHAEWLADSPGAGIPSTLDFEGLPAGAAIGGQFAADAGVSFTSPVGVYALPEAFGSAARGARAAVVGFSLSEGAELAMQFAEPQRAVSFWLLDGGSDTGIEAWLDGELRESLPLTAPGEGLDGGVFLALWFDLPPDEVRICASSAEDGFGVDDVAGALPGTVDNDGDGVPESLGDCDDEDPLVFPDISASCESLDSDCDGVPDSEEDGDGDGFDPCSGDCDDSDPSVRPQAPEQCDGVDNDCDGLVDERPDADGDGFTPCEGDCDDGDAELFPGQGCEDGGGDDDSDPGGDDDTGPGGDDDSANEAGGDDDADDDDGAVDDDGAGDDDDGSGEGDGAPGAGTAELPGIAGGGCACGVDGSGRGRWNGAAVLALLGLCSGPVRRRRHAPRRVPLVLSLLALALLAALPIPASAQQATLDTERFRPAPTLLGGAFVPGAPSCRPWQVELGLWVHGARRPVVFTWGDGTEDPAVRGRVGAVLQAGVHLGSRVRLVLQAPVTLYQDGVDPLSGSALARGAPGDLRFVPAALLLDPARAPLGLALSLAISFPTGRPEALLGEGLPTLRPAVSVERALGPGGLRRFVLAGEAGWHFRPRTRLLDFDSAGEFTWGLGVRWEPSIPLRIGTELLGAAGRGANARHAEWATWASFQPERRRQLDVLLGLSLGLGRGVGTPEGRVYAGVRGVFAARPGARTGGAADAGSEGSGAAAGDSVGSASMAASASGRGGDFGPPISAGGEGRGWGLRLVERQASVDARLLFAVDSAELGADAPSLLTELSRWFLGQAEGVLLEVDGHADVRGSASYNDSLGLRRAAAVRDWLVAHGVPAQRVEVRSFGERRPLDAVPGGPEAAWTASRRVEFRIVAPSVSMRSDGAASSPASRK